MMVRFLIAASLCVCARAVAVGVPTAPSPPPYAPGGKCYNYSIVAALTSQVLGPGLPYAPELLAECQVVVGDLELIGDIVPESINMPNLEAMTGKFNITNANKLHSLLLPKLRGASDLVINFAPKLTNLDLSEFSAGNFYVNQTSLTQLDLPSFVSSPLFFVVAFNIKLTKIYVPQQPAANLSIGTQLLAIGNPMLDCIDLPITARVNLNIKGNKACDCTGPLCLKDACGPPMKSEDVCDAEPFAADAWIAPRSRECDPEEEIHELCVARGDGLFESCICEDHSGAERKILFGAPPKSCFCEAPKVVFGSGGGPANYLRISGGCD